jgi:hypothetical protein
MDPQKMREMIATKRRAGSVIERLRGVTSRAEAGLSGHASDNLRVVVEDTFAAARSSGGALVARRANVVEQFIAFTDDDWNRAVDLLLPHVADAAKQALISLEHRPYQVGPTRKPFRAPRSRDVLAMTRGRWLMNVTRLVGEFDEDISWIAAHGAYLAGWWGSPDLGWLLAGAIDARNEKSDDVRDILIASAKGEHEVGSMGRHVTQALMSGSDPAGWDFVEKLLIAAQREEGVRQAILESVDESHPQAFRRMLRLIVDEKLARFSSLVRAADTWFGFMWDGSSAVKVDAILTRVLRFLDDADARMDALRERDPETAYLALWTLAFDDVDTSIEPALRLLSESTAELRFVGTHFLAQTASRRAMSDIAKMLTDEDHRVAARALRAFAANASSMLDGTMLFEQLALLMKSAHKRTEALPSIVWPWNATTLERPDIAAVMVSSATAETRTRLLPYVADLEPMGRAAFIRHAAGIVRGRARATSGPEQSLTKEERTLAIELLGDPSGDVRAAAFDAMATVPLANDEVQRLIDLLSRKPGDLRNAAIKRLSTLDDARLLSAAETLMADDVELRRQAGLELLRVAVENNRLVDAARARVQQYAATHTTGDDVEQRHIDAIRAENIDVRQPSGALGLIDETR